MILISELWVWLGAYDDEQARKPLSVASVIEAPASILKHGGRYKEDRSREVDGVRYDVGWSRLWADRHVFRDAKGLYISKWWVSFCDCIYILYLWVLISLYNIMKLVRATMRRRTTQGRYRASWPRGKFRLARAVSERRCRPNLYAPSSLTIYSLFAIRSNPGHVLPNSHNAFYLVICSVY